MPYCTECGTPVGLNNKFCPNCGIKLEPVPQRADQQQGQTVKTQPVNQPTTFYPQPQEDSGEQIKTIIPNLSVYKSLGRFDNYNLIVTDRRSIFSKMTNEMMNKTIKARRDKAEAEGKGFFGKWKAQMAGFNTYTDYYEGMTPEQILVDHKENYFVDNSRIVGLEIRDKSSDDGGADYYGVEIETVEKKLKFRTQYDPTDAFNSAYNLSKK